MQKTDYIFGLHTILEALQSERQIDKVLVKKDINGDLAKEVLRELKNREIPVQRVPMERLNRITMRNHQGVIAMLTPVVYRHLDDVVQSLYEEGKNPLVLVLDSLTDTRNFGAIARTAECAGVDTIVIPTHDSVSASADAVKTSAGALLHLKVCREKNLENAVEYLRQSGFRIIGATEKGNCDYIKADYKGPTAIVMGAEDCGISLGILRKCDDLARIPIMGNVGSLNVSVAAALMMYEALRQRTGK